MPINDPTPKKDPSIGDIRWESSTGTTSIYTGSYTSTGSPIWTTVSGGLTAATPTVSTTSGGYGSGVRISPSSVTSSSILITDPDSKKLEEANRDLMAAKTESKTIEVKLHAAEDKIQTLERLLKLAHEDTDELMHERNLLEKILNDMERYLSVTDPNSDVNLTRGLARGILDLEREKARQDLDRFIAERVDIDQE